MNVRKERKEIFISISYLCTIVRVITVLYAVVTACGISFPEQLFEILITIEQSDTK